MAELPSAFQSAYEAAQSAKQAAQSARTAAAQAIKAAAQAEAAYLSAIAAGAVTPVGTETPTAHAVPKSGDDGTLDPGWLPAGLTPPPFTISNSTKLASGSHGAVGFDDTGHLTFYDQFDNPVAFINADGNLQFASDIGLVFNNGVPAADFFQNGPLVQFVLHNGFNFKVGADSGDVAVDATWGFMVIPYCHGTPTGIPAAAFFGGPFMVFDIDNFILYAYINGTGWKSVAFT